MATIAYDDRSLIMNGERLWLVSGSIHYFRVPAELWADRLLKAKRAGLNCISTVVPWGLHEPQEGQLDLEGNLDVVEFVHLAEEAGLYVTLRPGPYVGADLDFGGLPPWLRTKSGMSYRTSSAAFTHYFDKYFRQMLPHLADLQVTRGGNIVLIQAENDYRYTAVPDRENYLSFISQLFRRSGFDVPIITCNGFSDSDAADSIECVNTSTDAVEQLKQLRLHRPDAMLLAEEFRTGQADCWGEKHEPANDIATARRALEILGCGAQFNYYMWHGGTNFGFIGGRQAKSPDAFQATSYDFDAPLAEGGGLTRGYYLTKLVNMLATHMGPFLAGCAMEEPGVSVHDSTGLMNTYGPTGRWAVVTNNGREDITTARLSLPEGGYLTVPLTPLGATAVPVDLRLSDTHTLDYSNLMPLGLFAATTLVLHGPAGFEARLSVNGNELAATVPADEDISLVDHQGLAVVLINSDLAQRTWWVEDTLVFGPAFVGETLDDVTCSKDAVQYSLLSTDGKLSHKKARHVSTPKPKAPRLGQWKRRQVCTEPASKNLEWTPLDRLMDTDAMGIHCGYSWRQVKINADRPRKRNLMLPECADRATIYLNSQRIGVWGLGDGATREPIGVNFKRGENVLTLLVDNLGRFQSGYRLGEPKGLYGPIHDAKQLRTKTFKLKAMEHFSKRLVPRQLVHMIPALKKLPVYSGELDIPLTQVTPLAMSFSGLDCHIAVICNERVVAFFPNDGENFGDLMLGAELQKGKNAIRLVVWGEVTAKELDQAVRFYALNEDITEGAQWSYRTWQPPTEEGPVVGKNQPAWYISKFKSTLPSPPLFLHLLGCRKGHVFLNGHNVGRFWNVGPQSHYYLPECWLEEVNELLIFEESGLIPSGTRLELRPRGPYRD